MNYSPHGACEFGYRMPRPNHTNSRMKRRCFSSSARAVRIARELRGPPPRGKRRFAYATAMGAGAAEKGSRDALEICRISGSRCESCDVGWRPVPATCCGRDAANAMLGRHCNGDGPPPGLDCFGPVWRRAGDNAAPSTRHHPIGPASGRHRAAAVPRCCTLPAPALARRAAPHSSPPSRPSP
jgi:hypothetical protein